MAENFDDELEVPEMEEETVSSVSGTSGSGGATVRALSSSTKSSNTDEIKTEEVERILEYGDDAGIVWSSEFEVNPSLYFAQLRAKQQDLLNEFGATEVFLIDGDSLLLELLSNANADWKTGGQFLHLVFLLEKYLATFKERQEPKHSFKVVFFEEHRALWAKEPSQLLARELLIRHLESNQGSNPVVHFASWNSKEWNDFVKDTVPSFVMICDRQGTDDITYTLRSFIIHCLKNQRHVVFTSRITPVGNKVLGYVLRGHAAGPLHPFLGKLLDACSEKLAGKKVDTPAFDLATFAEASKAVNKNGWRGVLGLYAAIRVLTQNPASIPADVLESLTKAFLVHQVLLKALALPLRSQRIFHTETMEVLKDVPYIKHYTAYLSALYTHMYSALTNVGAIPEVAQLQNNFCDVVDGRLLYKTLIFFIKSKGVSEFKQLGLDAEDTSSLQAAWSLASKTGFFPVVQSHVAIDTSVLEPIALIDNLAPVHSPLINSCVEGLNIKEWAENDPELDRLKKLNNKFWNNYGWQSGAVPFESVSIEDEERNDRLLQKSMAYVHKLAQSLEGRQTMHQKAITVKEAEPEKKDEVENDKPKVIAKKDLQKTKSKAEKLKEENLARMAKKKEEGEAEKWKNAKELAQRSIDERKPEAAIETYDMFLRSCAVPSFAVEALIEKLKLSFKQWNAAKNDANRVRVFQSVHEIANLHMTAITKPQMQFLLETLCIIGFVDSAKLLFDEYSEAMASAPPKPVPEEPAKKGKGKPGAKPKKEKSSKKKAAVEEELTLEEMWEDASEGHDLPEPEDTRTTANSAVRFQMAFMGPSIPMDIQGTKDDRVPFIPDNWQRELLDAVDQNKSALISAPTSSGKTFISYYCMEKVLRNSEEDLVIYVAPTRALVNQVAADVYFRFGNRRYSNPGRNVYGVYTTDYRYSYMNCQVLITVPTVLETLLLSPEHASWLRKLKYVIFDEIHCIGEMEGGSIWERLLQLIKCPFLALSATVGNPTDFKSWLESIQKKKYLQSTGKDASDEMVVMIEHKERFSDLQKYIYLPSYKDEISQKSVVRSVLPSRSDVYKDASTVLPFHSLGSVDYDKLKSGWPQNLSFVPAETLELYEAMYKVAKEGKKEDLLASLKPLNPETRFAKVRLLTRSKVRAYEKDLTQELKNWITKDLREEVTKVIAVVSDGYQGKVSSMAEEWLAHGVDTQTNTFLNRNIMDLILSLSYQDKLPAIIFNFDRKKCERMMETIVDTLERWEAISEGTDSERKKQEKEKEKIQKLKARKRDDQEKKKPNDTPEDEYAEEEEDESQANARFTFVREGEGMDKDEWNELLRSLRYLPKSSYLIRALYRGIGVHHPGLPNKYRQAVERLFRCKHIKIVIATQTLALGIHMPCRSVIFAGDSPHLNALQFRQMSGRAGRRGFDPVGHVIFYGLPISSVKAVISADLSLLRGHFPISTTLLLQMSNLYAKVPDSELQKGVSDAMERLVKNPFFLLGKGHLKEQMAYQFRYTLEYLWKQGYINEDASPSGLISLATLLNNTEPDNFAFLGVLKSGILHQICSKQVNDNSAPKQEDEIILSLLIVLGHIFKRQYLHPAIKSDPRVNVPGLRVIQPKLPGFVADILDDLNSSTIRLWTKYLTNYVKTTLKEAPETQLPASGLTFNGSINRNVNSVAGSLVDSLSQSAIPFTVRSAFSALTGLGDDFESVEDLIQSVRDGVYLDSTSIPVVSLPSYKGDDFLVNAYLTDFYFNGSLDTLRTLNGLNSGDAFLLLKEFNGVLHTLLKAIKVISPLDTRNEDLRKYLTIIEENFARQFARLEQ